MCMMTPEMKTTAFAFGNRFYVMDPFSVMLDSLVESPNVHCVFVSRAVRLLDNWQTLVINSYKTLIHNFAHQI